jgi:para-nitrobenzyl esterase
MVVSCLLSSPLTKDLIRRAIVQSGHGSSVYPMEIARRAVDKIADHLGVTPDIDGFRSASQEQTLDALARAARPGALDLRDERGFDPNFGLQIINPVYGDDVLPAHPLAAVAAGAGADVDLLVGTTAEEANFWFATTPLRLLPKSALRWLLRRVNTQADAIIDAYAAELPGRSGAALLAAALTDLAFRWPARQFAAAHRGRTHVFEFGWRSPAVRGRLGAAHGLDLAFVFDTLAVASGPRGIAGEHPPQDLADHVHGLWVRFATDGTLPWEEFGDSRQVYQLAERAARHEPTMTAAEFLPTVMDWNP